MNIFKPDQGLKLIEEQEQGQDTKINKDKFRIMEKLYSLYDAGFANYLMGISSVVSRPEILQSEIGVKHVEILKQKILDFLEEINRLSPRDREKLGPVFIISMEGLLVSIDKKDWLSVKDKSAKLNAFFEGMDAVLSIVGENDENQLN